MAEVDLKSEQFMTLLTDALRAGPGSPEWHQAVRILRTSNQNVDEYTLLYSARENLESGKGYRSVQPGPQFTRKVMDGLEQQSTRTQSKVPLATVIGVIATLVIIGVVSIVAYLATRGQGDARQQAIDELGNRFFVSRGTTLFTGSAVPADWKKFGELPLTIKSGQLRSLPYGSATSIPSTTASSEYKPGGVVTTTPLAADGSFEVGMMLHVNRAGEDGIVQLFVSDTPLDDEHTTGTHEIVWLFQGGQAKVFITGRAEGSPEKFAGARDLPVKLILSRDLAIVEAGGKRMYAGPNHLGSTQPRYAGVRFLRKAGETWDHLGVVSITVAK